MGCNKGLPSTCHTSWKWGWVQNINRLSKASDESPSGYHWVIKGGKHLLTIINLYLYIYIVYVYMYMYIYIHIYIYIYIWGNLKSTTLNSDSTTLNVTFFWCFFSFRSGFKRAGFPHLYPTFPLHLTQRRAKPSHRRRVIAVVPWVVLCCKSRPITLWCLLHSYWKLPFVVSFPIKHGDFT